jgi:hypothetical protein
VAAVAPLARRCQLMNRIVLLSLAGVAGLAAACSSGGKSSSSLGATVRLTSSSGSGSTGSTGTSGSSGAAASVCAPCAQDGDCGGSGTCLHIPTYSQGYCSPACQSSSDCGDAGFCTSLGVTATGCYPTTGVCYAAGSSSSGSSGAPCTADTWANYASDFFANACEGCHGFAGLQLAIASQAPSIVTELNTNHEAPDGGYATADVARLTTWLNCGAP